jgi:hypothetical protein
MIAQAPAVEAWTIDVSPEEQAAGRLSEASREKGVQAMQRLGFLHINNVLTRERVDALRRAYDARYAPDRDASPRTVCYPVGHKRDIVAVDLAGPFNDPLVYANPFFFPVVDDVLGGTAGLNSFGAVCALPGARAQRVHVEHPALFAETNLEPLLPCHALTSISRPRRGPRPSGSDRTGIRRRCRWPSGASMMRSCLPRRSAPCT